MENKSSKVVYYVIGVILLVAVALIIINMKNPDDEAVVPGSSDTTALDSNLTPSDVTQATEDTSEGSVNVGAPAVSISYANALIKYADKRIQLDKDCQAFPNKVTYKDNTGIMIDNRAPVARTVKIGVNYTVKAYGFKIVVLPDIYLKSKTILVDCDKSQNVATILVQE